MCEGIIVMKMKFRKFLTGLLCVTALVSQSFGISRDWIEGYRACRGDEREEILRELEKYRDVLDALMNYKMFLLGGVIPAPLVIEKARIHKRPDGILVLKKEVEVVPPDKIDLTVLKQLKIDLDKHITFQSGYWLFMKIKDVPDYEVAYYRYLGKKLGLSPFVFNDWLVFAMYRKESEALNDKVMLERAGVPDLNIAYVEKEDMR